MAETLKEKTARGLLWAGINSGSTQILSAVIGIFLSRTLSPADYAVVGMLTIFTVLAVNIQDSGFANALINLRKPTANDYNSVFWFNILTSFVLYAVLFASAPLIALFFRQPCLTELSRFLFITFVIASFGISHNAYLTKNLMNREKAVISLSATAVSGIVGITLALAGKGYWSLAWQQVIFNSVTLIGRYWYTAWHPSFRIDFAPVRRMFGFSYKILVPTVINTLSENVLTFIFGRLYPVKDVGYYAQARKWELMAHSFMNMTVSQVAQPVFSEVNEDRERQRQVFRKMLRFTAFVSFPALLGLAMVSHEFIVVALTAKWEPAVILLQVLSVSGSFAPFYILFQNLAISRGRSDIYLWCNVGQVVLMLALVIGLHSFGMTVMVVAYAVFYILWLLVWQRVARRLIGLRLAETLRDILPFFFIAVAVMLATYYSTLFISSLPLLLGVRIIVAVALHVGLMKLLKVKMLEESWAYLRKKRH